MADLFCLATRNEGWCNGIIEALAWGLPVLTTSAGGNQKIVREGRNSLLVPFWDAEAFRAAVGAALARPWNRAEISTGARVSACRRTAHLIMQVFTDALPGAATAPGPTHQSVR